MIKFEFTLSDVDAENFVQMFNREISRTQMLIIEEDDSNMRSWYSRHIKYLQQLKQTILAGNKRIEEMPKLKENTMAVEHDYAEILRAIADGKEIEIRDGHVWKDIDDHEVLRLISDDDIEPRLVRVKPELI